MQQKGQVQTLSGIQPFLHGSIPPQNGIPASCQPDHKEGRARVQFDCAAFHRTYQFHYQRQHHFSK
jgi:hypothetical protein